MLSQFPIFNADLQLNKSLYLLFYNFRLLNLPQTMKLSLLSRCSNSANLWNSWKKTLGIWNCWAFTVSKVQINVEYGKTNFCCTVQCRHCARRPTVNTVSVPYYSCINTFHLETLYSILDLKPTTILFLAVFSCLDMFTRQIEKLEIMTVKRDKDQLKKCISMQMNTIRSRKKKTN